MTKYLTLLVFLGCSVLLTGCQIPHKDAKAALQVVTGDIQASLFIDGQYVEKTPYVNKSLQSGRKVLRIDPDTDQLLDHELTVDLKPGLMTVVTWLPGERPELNAGVIYELEKIDSDQSELKISSIPDGAIITMADHPKSFAPTTFPLAPGEYEYEVSLPAYRTQKHSVKLNPGYRTVASLNLARDGKTTGTLNQAVSNASTSAIASPSGNRSASISAQVSGTTATAAAHVASVNTGPRVKILATNFRQQGVEGLRVRSAASASGAELGFAPTGSTYRYTGQSQSGWHQIEFASGVGWVSSQFCQLIRE